MRFNTSFAFVVWLAAAVALSGCVSFGPAVPTLPPVDGTYGAVSVSVDLSPLAGTGVTVESVGMYLVGQGRTIAEELPITGWAAEAEFPGIPAGLWDASVTLYGAGGDVLASYTGSLVVPEEATVRLELAARAEGGQVTLETVEEIPEPPGEEPGTEPDPGEPGEQPGDKPGAEEPGEEPGEQPGEQPGEEPGQEPGQPDPAPELTREVRYIQSGNRTETRTEVYIIRAAEPGPTVMLVGGVHGSERSGWMVATEVAQEWEIDRGTLVVIPQANKDAVRLNRRTGRDGRDLNRAFPRNRELNRSSDWLLAREIWNVVLEFQPEALLDLHEGWGLREAGDRFPGGTLSVGQTIIVYPAGDARDFAEHLINVLNTEHNPLYGRNGLTYNFRIIGPPVDGSLARKAGNDLGIPAFIAEPTQGRAGRYQTTLQQRQHWHRVIVEEYLRWYGLLD
nr:hypothetical protein [Bacillota bacterium]